MDSENKKRRRRAATWQRVVANIFKVLGTLLLIGITTGAILACFAAVYIQTIIMPDTDLSLQHISLDLTSSMYYTDPETGQDVEYLTLHGDENRVWIAYEDLPENLINATVAIEDKRFYTHKGVDWIRTARGLLNMFTGGKIEGGSTLTQQLIKNLTEYDDVTVKRKIVEIFSALEFDKNYSKEETLEWYLNYIYFGEGCNGVYTASYAYFGKHVSELSLAECASLISITNNPSLYNPYLNRTPSEGNPSNLERNKWRQTDTLYFMCDQGYITEAERDAALAEELVFQRGQDEARPTKIYTWYQDKVVSDVIADLQDTYRWSKEVASSIVYSGGLKIYTCLDPRAQTIVDEVYGNTDNLNFISNSGQQMQSGIAIMDNLTGNIVALAGGMGPKTESRSWSRASDTVRPPGSSIKPLSVYSPALEMGLITPYTILDDVPYQMEGDTAWPVNSYGYFRGRMSVFAGVEVSSNPLAVKVLSDYITPRVSIDFLRSKFRLSSLVDERWINNYKFTDIDPAPLALGGLTDGVSVYEMTAAYAAFPRMGKYVKPRTYTLVTDSEGKVLLDNTPQSEFVLKQSTAYYINNMLKNVVTNGTGTAARFSGSTLAGKTGTTTSRKDRWFVGYSYYYTAAVWTGYDQQERMDYTGNPPATLWKQVMEPLHAELENVDFPRPSDVDLVSASYCLDSGLIPGDYCALDPRGSRVATGSFVRGDQPMTPCTMHQPVEVCLASPILDANGVATGVFHLAGEHCPEDEHKTIALLDFERVRVKDTVVARDDMYLHAYLDAMGEEAFCTVHTTPSVPEVPFNPMDQSTWPTHDPNFNIEDPLTWPPVVIPPWEPIEPPEQGEQPIEPDPTQGPDDTEPYVPVT